MVFLEKRVCSDSRQHNIAWSRPRLLSGMDDGGLWDLLGRLERSSCLETSPLDCSRFLGRLDTLDGKQAIKNAPGVGRTARDEKIHGKKFGKPLAALPTVAEDST